MLEVKVKLDNFKIRCVKILILIFLSLFLAKEVDFRILTSYIFEIVKRSYLFHLNFVYEIEIISALVITFISAAISLLLIYMYLFNRRLITLCEVSLFSVAVIMNIFYIESIMKANYLSISFNAKFYLIISNLYVLTALLLDRLYQNKKINKVKILLTTVGLFLLLFLNLLSYDSYYYSLTILSLRSLLFVIVGFNITIYKLKDEKQSELLILRVMKLILINNFISFLEFNTSSHINIITSILRVIAYLYLFKVKFAQELINAISAKGKLKERDKEIVLYKENINDLRIARHDFKNQLQTIHTMLQLNKIEEVKEYILDLNLELNNLSSNIIEDNILSAVLLPKKEKALEMGISFDIKVNTDLKHISIARSKLFKLLFNLIDNSLDVLVDSIQENKEIKVIICDDGKNVSLHVYNNGPAISDELMDHIFKAGYSTKGKDRGFGLYIVKSLVENYGGRLKVESEENYGTRFVCSFPKIFSV
ncbi:sensor kinase SpoOB-type protein [Orenia marismortui]|uniref:histidine kinase n=1 Tax=Orenia marismortui TaxID=46469 RepID=A0A4R8H0C3_9FIRM|nr:sensor kinase SpoOB-type protein [Orenia marismortui]